MSFNRTTIGSCFGTWVLICAVLAGCSTTSRNASMQPEAFEAAQKRVIDEKIPEDLQPHFILLYGEGRENQALNAMKAGLAALRLGYTQLAGRAFDLALRDVQALQEGTEQADRAKSKFVAEQEKWFKGESFERSALYFYRGLVYLQEADFGNAAACFKQSQVQDLTGEDERKFQGDWFSSEIALAFASYKQGLVVDAKAALQRAASFGKPLQEYVLPQKEDDLLVVVEVGHVPIKIREGAQGEKLAYQDVPPKIHRIRLKIPNHSSLESPAAEDLYFQAVHRGIRKVDEILEDKTAFKEMTDTASTVLGVGTIVSSQVDDTGIATGALAAAAVVAAAASSATRPECDIRAWDNLPHSLFLFSLSSKDLSSLDGFTVEALDSHSHVVADPLVAIKPTPKNPLPTVCLVRLK